MPNFHYLLRHLTIYALILLAGCGAPPPPKVEQPKPDPTLQPEYAVDAAKLADLVRQAGDLYHRGRSDAAADLIKSAQPLQDRVLSAPKPTLAAMQAASDLDDLYGRMLLANHHDGWARMLYQKNIARWKAWQPQTEDTLRRLKQAQDGIAACDRSLSR